MTVEETFKEIGYKKVCKGTYEKKLNDNEFLYLVIDKCGCSKWFQYTVGNEVGTGMLSMEKGDMEACIKALEEMEA